jgi:hypothetical protein
MDDMEKRKFLTLPGLELHPLGHPTHSQSLFRLCYPSSSLSVVWEGKYINKHLHEKTKGKESENYLKETLPHYRISISNSHIKGINKFWQEHFILHFHKCLQFSRKVIQRLKLGIRELFDS